MITATESPELVAHYRQRINDILSGKITIPETRYERHLVHDEIHASEVDGSCLHRAYYNRTLDEIPPLSGNAPLLFLRGRGVERMLITKQPIVVKDGISMEIDDHIEPWGIIEIKSTAADSGYFEPVSKFPHWINRGGIYCVGHGADCFYLVVYFLVGNLWSSMKRGFQGEKKKVDFRAWRISMGFEGSDLSLLWNNAQERRRILIEAIDSGIPPDIDPEAWECLQCNLSPVCHYARGQARADNYLREQANKKVDGGGDCLSGPRTALVGSEAIMGYQTTATGSIRHVGRMDWTAPLRHPRKRILEEWTKDHPEGITALNLKEAQAFFKKREREIIEEGNPAPGEEERKE